MKKDRNCGNAQYPVYPMPPMMNQQMMPMPMMTQPMMPMTQVPTTSNYNYNDNYSNYSNYMLLFHFL